MWIYPFKVTCMIFYKVIICLAGFLWEKKYMTSEGVRVQPIYEFQTLETYIFDFKKKAVMT